MADMPYVIVTDKRSVATDDGPDAGDAPDNVANWTLGLEVKFTPVGGVREMTLAATGEVKEIDDFTGVYNPDGELRRYADEDDQGAIAGYGPAGVSLPNLSSPEWVSPFNEDEASWSVSFSGARLPNAGSFTPRSGTIRPGYEGETRLGVLLPQAVVNGVPVVRGEPGPGVVDARNDGPDAAVFILEGGGETSPVDLPPGPQGQWATGAAEDVDAVTQMLENDTTARDSKERPRRTLTRHRTVGGTEPAGFLGHGGDDGYGTFEPLFALGTARGIMMTLFLSTAYVDRPGLSSVWNDTFITTAQVQAIVDAGHELATHGHNHEGYADYRQANGDAALHALMVQCKQIIKDDFGYDVVTGAYPGGLSNRRVREIVGRTHDFYRGTKGRVAARGQDPFDVTAIDVQTLTEAQMRAYVDEAAAGAQVHFLVHGGLSPAFIAQYGRVMDYATSIGVRQGTFRQAMEEITAVRGPSAHQVTTSGDAFYRSTTAHRVAVRREDFAHEEAWWDIEEGTNTPYFDAIGGTTWEMRKPWRAMADIFVGGRRLFDDAVLTSGSPNVTSGAAGFSAADIGLTITGPGIPAGATIASVTNAGTAVMSAAATASNNPASIVLGRSDPSAQFNGPVDFYGPLAVHPNAGLEFRNASGPGVRGYLSASLWARDGAGGPMSIHTGTGGSPFELTAFRLRFTDHTGQRRIALCAAQPSDASLVNGEVGLYFDTATGELKFRGKTDAGAVVQRTVTTV